MRLLKITRGQHSALISIVASYMRKPDEPQQFIDCSQDPAEETTTNELLDLLLNFGLGKYPGGEKAAAGVTQITSFAQLEGVIGQIFQASTPAHLFALQLIEAARECGKVEALKDLQDRKLLETMKPVTETTQ